MTYTGEVTPGDPTDVRELPALTIRKVSVCADTHNNVYLLTCKATGDQLLIDAADETDRILALVAEGTGRLGHLVTSHQHWDHTRSLADVLAKTGARSYAGEQDADGLPVPPDVRLTTGDTVRCGDIELEVMHISGHTPGSVALAYRDPGGHAHVFTGDCLFPGGVGATDRPGQDFDSLYAGVVTQVFDRFDDDTWIYPGHGNDTTLGVERPHLEEWRERRW